jgi:hypothetical protein
MSRILIVISKHVCLLIIITLWPKSPRKPYLPSDRRLSAKLVPTFADRAMSRDHCAGIPRP